MSKIVTKACIIGSGVMGANIAALLASVGMQVTLLDIVPFNGLDEKEKAAGLTEDSLEFRNRLVNGAVTKLQKDKQMPLLSKGAIKNIRVGNTSDNLNLMEDADWIIEVVVERLDIKKSILKQIAIYAKADAVISSNTSGVSITKIVEDMGDSFKKRFMGTHFFNPPRWMGLFEMIPTPVDLPRDNPDNGTRRRGTFWAKPAFMQRIHRTSSATVSAVFGCSSQVMKSGREVRI